MTSPSSFVLRLSAGANDTDVTPVTWSDGYVTLMPGEQQTLTARYRTADLHGEPPSVRAQRMERAAIRARRSLPAASLRYRAPANAAVARWNCFPA